MNTITVTTRLDPGTYRTFACFNNYRAFHRWVGFAVFLVVMTALSFVNLYTGSRTLFIIFLSIVLLVILWGSVLYPLMLNRQIKKLKLDENKTAYMISLSKNGIHVNNGREKADYRWNMVYTAYKTADCIYLYMTKSRCFILPEKDIQDEKNITSLWKLLNECLQKYQLKSI